ncbi:hypothetical protein ACIBM3_30950, partial [Rhodococcus erythropolis]|uniref:hypothetical protein n=1 Tax=Rhodococcus erythropolis TaxID=1833 RepID=UPI00378A5070
MTRSKLSDGIGVDVSADRTPASQALFRGDSDFNVRLENRRVTTPLDFEWRAAPRSPGNDTAPPTDRAAVPSAGREAPASVLDAQRRGSAAGSE